MKPMRHATSPHRVLTPLGLAICLSLFGDLTLYAVLTTRRADVGLTLGAVGIMLGVNRLIRIPGNLLAGSTFDRGKRRRLFLTGMLIGTLSTAGFGVAKGFIPFLITRLAWGIAWTLINVGGLAMVFDISSSANRGRLTGIYNAWLLAGVTLGPLIGSFLVDSLGFQPALLICTGCIALGLLIAILSLPETATQQNDTTANSKTSFPPLRTRIQRLWADGISTLSTRPELLSLLILTMIFQFAGEGITISTINLLLEQRFGQTVHIGHLSTSVIKASGGLLALRAVIAGIAGALGGRFSDTTKDRLSIIIISLITGIGGFVLLSVASVPWSLVLAITLGAISTGSGIATLAAHLGDLTPTGRQGVIMGAYATAGDIGCTLGPFLAFALTSIITLREIYLISAVVFLIGLSISIKLQRVPTNIFQHQELKIDG